MTVEKRWQDCANAQEALEQIQMIAQDVYDGKDLYDSRGELAEVILEYTTPHVGPLPTVDDDALLAEVRRRGLLVRDE